MYLGATRFSQVFTCKTPLMKSSLVGFTMSKVQMRDLVLAAVSIGLILLHDGLCSSQESGNQLSLPIVCKETDVPQIFQEDGSLFCWQCECFDDKRWGCFQGSGNCSNAVPPIIAFGKCKTAACDESDICFSYGTGDLWVEPTNELCWCDDGDSKCNINSALAANETKNFSNFSDYRNSSTVCVKDEKIVLNFGDAVLTNCSICTCINGSFWCSEMEDCEQELPQLACPLVVSDDCQQPIRELCTNDSQCEGNTKCCLRGCVRQCEVAVPAGSVTKPGSCPDLQVGLPNGLVARCFTDYDCEGHLKCCSHDSTFVCLEPYNPNNCQDSDDIVPCTFFNPCEFTRCPKHPEARCRISHCGTCHAQYFVDNIRVNCFEDDVCDIDTPLLPCFLDENCAFQDFRFACPAAPQAECRLNYCGNCFFEFFNTSGDKIACHRGDPCPLGVQEFDCEYMCTFNNFCPGAGGANVTCVPTKCGGCGFPKFYYDNGTEVQCFNLEENCPEGSVLPSTCTDNCNDPAFSCTNPDVVTCHITYCEGKCTSEYFNANGERVSCFGGRPCPTGQQETPFCPSDCGTAACLAYPDAVCEIDSCDYRCSNVFYNSDTNTTVNCSEGYTCPEENPVSPFCTDTSSDFLFPGCFVHFCDRNPDAKCFESPCGFCHPEFYFGQERVNCYGDIPCPQGIAEFAYCENLCGTTVYCPADLSAICLMDHCGKCQTVFQDLKGNIIEDCFAGGQCPTGEVDALCPYNLCKSETCETHPEAECRLNHCGICRAQFFLPNGTEITNCSAIGCHSDVAPLFCGDLCSGIVCTRYPNATCVVNNCGECKVEFFSPNGIHLSAEDCGVSERQGFCPAEHFHPTLLDDCETDSDCVFPLKCCSNLPGLDLIKFCTEPLEVHPHSCEYEGTQYDPHGIRLEECQLCTCLLGRWACYDTKCDLMCAVDNIANCNAENCNPMEKLCPAYPDARCTTNPCGGCTVEHLLQNDTVVDCYDADLLQCPEGEIPVTCEFNPCPPICEAYPDAICRVNVCGSCKAEHVLDNRIVDCNKRPSCFYMGHEYTEVQEVRISDEECNLCICVSFNNSFCFSLGGPCADPLPCKDNGVEYPPLFRRRENCTECVCSEIISGKFGCFEIPDSVDYEKTGVCPPKQGSPNECFEEVIHECDHDGNCTGSDKCCHEYCGSICEKPVPEGPTCFSCISYFSDDIPNTGDVCSDVAVPSVDIVKCITGMVCASIRAEATFNVLDQNPEVTQSLNIVQRGCFWPENISQNASGCIKGNDTTLPTVYDETEEWILQHEGTALIKEFFVSACFCKEHICNSVVLPLPQTTTQLLLTTATEGSNSRKTSLNPSSSTTLKGPTTQTTLQETSVQAISTTTPTAETTTSTTTSLKTSSPSTPLHATSTQVPMTETTLQPTHTTTTLGATSSTGTSPRTSSPSSASEGNFCTLQGKPSAQGSFQSNPCSNCVCVDGFFLCRFNGTCLSDVVVEEVLYTLTGDFADITGMEKQFGRTLIQNLARELMIDETVFLDIKLSAGSVKVKQNITDSRSVDATAREISKQIQEKVDMRMISFTFNGKNYRSVSGTFEVSQSYQFSPPSSGISAGVVAVIATAVLVVICLLMVLFIVVFSAWRKGKIDTENAVLLRLSRSPSMNSDKIGPVEFENPVYSN